METDVGAQLPRLQAQGRRPGRQTGRAVFVGTERFGGAEFTTMHHCIQGWTGIAQWKGVPMRKFVDLVKPKPSANVVAFFSFGEGLYGGVYYNTQTLG